MRIALVHSFYSSRTPSGENEVVTAQAAAWQRAGCDVRLLSMRTDDREVRLANGVRTAVEVATGRGYDPTNELREFQPDVVHVHNLFPNYGEFWPSHLGMPVVATLHNYRSVCARGTLFRHGHFCYECPTRGPHRSLVHACYRDSRIATVPIAVAHVRRYPRLADYDALIVLSTLQKGLLEGAGVDSASMHIIPNYLPDALDSGAGPGGGTWVFVGRLVEEKGLNKIMASWPRDVPLEIIGDGPLRERLSSWSRGRNVHLRGRLDRASVQERLRTCRGLVFASQWPEPFGLVYLEALAAGLPVLAAPGTAVANLVEQDGTGVVVDDYTSVEKLDERFCALRQHVRLVFDLRYSEARNTAMHMALYQSVIDGR